MKFGVLWILFPRSHIFGPKENPALSGRGGSLGVRGPHPGCGDHFELGTVGGHLLRGVIWGRCSLSLLRPSHLHPRVLRPLPPPPITISWF